MRTGDGRIINQCLNGDHAIFGVLVDKYKEGIYALAYSKLGNFHDAQDITQETFIKAYQKLHTLRQHESFPVWLSAIASNLCKEFVRSSSARPDRECFDEQSTSVIDQLSIDLHKADSMTESLKDSLESLPEVYRQVLMLHYFSGLNRLDIAIMLGVSLRTVGERLKIAREKLREEMIEMIGTAIKEQKLPAGFTFRIVELVKRIKIQPVSQPTGLPWGLSLAIGLIITILSLNPAILHNDNVGAPVFAPMPSETKVLQSGEIPVDTVKISHIPMLSSMMDKGNGGESKPDDNAFFMAPQGEGGKWEKRADMPTGRSHCTSSVLNGRIYVIAGSAGNGAPVEEYNPLIDTWVKKADIPNQVLGRLGLSASTVNEMIYVFGGFSNKKCLSDVEEYDPVRDRWVKKKNMPTSRWLFSTSVVDNKIYAIGGGIVWDGKVSHAVEEYDPITDTWSKKGDMPNPRAGHASVVLNNRIYVIGGGLGLTGPYFQIVEEYDPVTDTWTRKADMPTPRGGLSAVVIDNKIYAIGGANNLRGPYLSVVEVYNPKTDSWTKAIDMPTKRCFFAANNVDSKIYAIGGCIETTNEGVNIVVKAVEEYDPNFAGKSVNNRSKLATTWGQHKEK